MIPTPRGGGPNLPSGSTSMGASGAIGGGCVIPQGSGGEVEDDFLSHGSHSNETLPLNEDPMNLVETSWDISTTLQHNGKQHSASNETTIRLLEFS